MAGGYTIYDLGLDNFMQRQGATLPSISPSMGESVDSGGVLSSAGSTIRPESLSSGELPLITYVAKQSFSDTTQGMRAGIDSDGTYKWIIGGSASSVDWNVTTANTLTVVGSITASSGTIGGFSIGADYIRDAANSFGLASTVTGGDDVRFWAGATFANRATAPFRLTEAGVLTAASGTIGGWTINATTITGGSVTIDSSGDVYAGQTAYDTGTGWYLDGSGTPRMSMGNSAGNKFTYDGTDFVVTGGNFLYSTATGRVTVTQVSTTGNTINATRNLASGSTDSPVVSIIQDNASDDQAALHLRQDSGTATVPALYVEAGRVGFGIAAPVDFLHLNSSVNEDGIRISQLGNGTADFKIALTNNNDASSRGVVRFQSSIDGGGLTTRMAFSAVGYVGIGTTSPESQLHIADSGTTYGGAIQQENTETSSYEWFTGVGGGDNAYVQGRGWFLRDKTAGATRISVLTTGNVGFGEINPDSLVHISQTQVTGSGLKVIRNLAAASTDSPLVSFIQDHASDDQVALYLKQDAAAPTLVIESNGDDTSIEIAALATTSDVFSVVGSSITSGGLSRFYSNSASATARTLVQITNDNTLATGVTSLSIQEDGGRALFLDQNANNYALEIDSEATTLDGLLIACDALTSGSIARFYSNSNSATARALVEIINDHADADGAYNLLLQNDGDDTHIRFTGDPANSSPTDGDFWYTGSRLNFYDGTETYDLLAPTSSVMQFYGSINDGLVATVVAGSSVTRTTLITTLSADDGTDGSLTATTTSLGGSEIDWDNNWKMTWHGRTGVTTLQDVSMGMYNITNNTTVPNNSTVTNKHVLFLIEDATLYASNADGTTQTKTDVSAGITLTSYNTYRIEFVAASTIRFYINNTLVATHTTNIPTSAGSPNPSLHFGVSGDGGSSKTLLINNNYTVVAEIP